MTLTKRVVGALLAAWCLLATVAAAATPDDASCKTVRLADVGWSDMAATNGLASVLLQLLGYQPQVTSASVPVTFTAMKNRQIDAFLGYWAPAMTPAIEPFVRAGQIRVLEPPNLAGARYTLAVPDYLYDKGLRSFEDIARFEKELGARIHGIEPGSDSNALIAGMIRDDRFGLHGFKLVENTEAMMVYEVQRAVRARKPIVFRAWEPHPMNVQLRLRYLSGGDAVFGPNYGAAQVHTALTPSFESRCPNAAALFRNLRFTTDIENQLLAPLMLQRAKPEATARDWLRRNPAVLETWLRGITTFDGREALPEAQAALKR